MPELEHLAESSLDHLRLVLAAGQIGIWELDLETGTAWRNSRHDEIFGYDELLPQWTYEQFLDHVIPADRGEVDDRQKQALERGEDWVFQCRITQADGEERWISGAGRPLIVDGAPTKIIGHVIDITDTKRNETRLETLTAELNHRVRNMLATIRAMISMSSRKASDVGRFGRALEGRVAALSRTHDLLVENADQLFSPRTIIEGELAAFEDVADRVTVKVSGRPRLEGNVAEGFTLVVHELLTNAIAHGALSSPAGRVAMDIEKTAGGMQLVWEESGGPPVEPDIQPGFGTRMMSIVLGGAGQVEFDYRPEGLRCVVTITG